jgi:hypothetical protein
MRSAWSTCKLATFDCGSVNMGDRVFANPMPFLRDMARTFTERGVKPEIECFDSGHVLTALRLRDEGVLPGPLHFQFVLGVAGGAPATLAALSRKALVRGRSVCAVPGSRTVVLRAKRRFVALSVTVSSRGKLSIWLSLMRMKKSSVLPLYFVESSTCHVHRNSGATCDLTSQPIAPRLRAVAAVTLVIGRAGGVAADDADGSATTRPLRHV